MRRGAPPGQPAGGAALPPPAAATCRAPHAPPALPAPANAWRRRAPITLQAASGCWEPQPPRHPSTQQPCRCAVVAGRQRCSPRCLCSKLCCWFACRRAPSASRAGAWRVCSGAAAPAGVAGPAGAGAAATEGGAGRSQVRGAACILAHFPWWRGTTSGRCPRKGLPGCSGCTAGRHPLAWPPALPPGCAVCPACVHADVLLGAFFLPSRRTIEELERGLGHSLDADFPPCSSSRGQLQGAQGMQGRGRDVHRRADHHQHQHRQKLGSSSTGGCRTL